jgi:hypothetical protein
MYAKVKIDPLQFKAVTFEKQLILRTLFFVGENWSLQTFQGALEPSRHSSSCITHRPLRTYLRNTDGNAQFGPLWQELEKTGGVQTPTPDR